MADNIDDGGSVLYRVLFPCFREFHFGVRMRKGKSIVQYTTLMSLILLVLFSYFCSVNATVKTPPNVSKETVAGQIKDVPASTKESVSGSPEFRRSRHHIDEVLQLDKPASKWLQGSNEKKILDELAKTYREDVKPMEDAYQFQSLQKHILSEGEMHAKPLVLFLGPWSTGKTTMINYLLGLEGTARLHTGAQPTTTDFTVVMHGSHYRTVEGMVLMADVLQPFNSLHKFGTSFAEKLTGIELSSKLLERVMIVDTPGIIENRKQQERGYPFNDVCQWFIDRAALIFLVFDPTKLDVGLELETLFQQLKGKESQIRLILNKADSVSTLELMKVYGALFWSLAPLVHVVEPPRIYIGSFWQTMHRPDTMHKLFYLEELSLLTDLNQIVLNHIEHKISYIRQHAILVRIHALLVDKYLETYRENKGVVFGDNEKLKADIIKEPESYSIYTSLLAHADISKHDLPSTPTYEQFFSIHPITSFARLGSHCPLLVGKCLMDKLNLAIAKHLPALLSKYAVLNQQSCDSNDRNCSN